MTKLILLLMCSLLVTHDEPCCDEQRMRQLTRDAEIVTVAEVVEVKPAPGFWSGQLAAIQHVRYKVVSVLKGSPPAREIEVWHYVVHNSRTADTERARLSPKIFKEGNQLVLFLKLDQEKHYIAFDENCGTVLADAEKVEIIQRLISVK